MSSDRSGGSIVAKNVAVALRKTLLVSLDDLLALAIVLEPCLPIRLIPTATMDGGKIPALTLAGTMGSGCGNQPDRQGAMYGWLPRGKSILVEAGMISVAAMYTASDLQYPS